MTYKEQATQEQKSKSELRECFCLDAGQWLWEAPSYGVFTVVSTVGPWFPNCTFGDQYKKDKGQTDAEFPFQKTVQPL